MYSKAYISIVYHQHKNISITGIPLPSYSHTTALSSSKYWICGFACEIYFVMEYIRYEYMCPVSLKENDLEPEILFENVARLIFYIYQSFEVCWNCQVLLKLLHILGHFPLSVWLELLIALLNKPQINAVWVVPQNHSICGGKEKSVCPFQESKDSCWVHSQSLYWPRCPNSSTVGTLCQMYSLRLITLIWNMFPYGVFNIVHWKNVFLNSRLYIPELTDDRLENVSDKREQ